MGPRQQYFCRSVQNAKLRMADVADLPGPFGITSSGNIYLFILKSLLSVPCVYGYRRKVGMDLCFMLFGYFQYL